jgi:hypothetical protein
MALVSSSDTVFKRYEVQITLTRPMLGTNPIDPLILDTHIIKKQREIISGDNKINSLISRYEDALQISDEQREAELNSIVDKLEEYLGKDLPPLTRKKILAGSLDTLKQTFAELEATGTTVFFWNKETKKPMIGSHMILGFLKAAGEALVDLKGEKKEAKKKKKGKKGEVEEGVSGEEEEEVVTTKAPKEEKEGVQGVFLGTKRATASYLNRTVSVESPFIQSSNDVIRHEGSDVPAYLQRSLRAETAKGPRVALAKSEQLPAGTKFRFVLLIDDKSPVTEDKLILLFDRGAMKGLGQWRNADYGKFMYKLRRIEDAVNTGRDTSPWDE